MGGWRGCQRVLPVSCCRLAELAAALERLRAEDGEKERAVEALTLQLQKLVGAGGSEMRGGVRVPGLGVQGCARGRCAG